MAASLIIIVFLVLLLAGVPVSIALGVAGTGTLLAFGLGGQMAGVNFVSSIASFPLLAIPFFILAGVILEKAGLASRIARFLELLVGPVTGGMAIVAVITCIFWGAISGSGPATTAAVGLLLVGPMVRQGYSSDFAAATIANAADLSIIIPPSIAFIIYGNLTGTSVSGLFMAGVIPGILMGLSIAAVAWYHSRKHGYRSPEKRGNGREILAALLDSLWALLAPVIILGGIYAGVFTPTEAAVVAVVYSLLVAMGIYRTVNVRDLLPILTEAAVTSSVIMTIVAFAGIFSWAASTTGLIDWLAEFIISASPNGLVTVLLINLLLLGLGMFLDAISISYLLMPILMPVLKVFGMDPLWYGVVFITALAIGQITPPVGVNIFTASNIADTSADAISKRLIPYVLVNFLVLTLLTLFPVLSTWLPVRLGLH